MFGWLIGCLGSPSVRLLYDWVWLLMIVRYEAARRLQDAAIVDSDLTRRMGRAFTKVLLFASGCKVCVVLVVPR